MNLECATSNVRLRAERVRSAALSGLALSLVAFFIAVVFLGLSMGHAEFMESVAACSSLAIALTGMTYIVLGLSASDHARTSP